MNLTENLKKQLLETEIIVDFLTIICDYDLGAKEWEEDKEVFNHYEKLLDKMPKLTDGNIIYEYRRKKE